MYKGRFGKQEAAHLLRRASARGRGEEASHLAEAGLERAVAEVLTDPQPAPEPPLPDDPKAISLNLMSLGRHWIDHWISTPTPAAERLTLFWHGHFTSEYRKVKRTRWMWQQNAIFRRLGPGPFPLLLEAVARDPAMLIYLDNARSRKEHPNENWARELLELFTLGEGHYTEKDVKEVARAFTGWSVTRPREAERQGRAEGFIFRRKWHDDGRKVFLGQEVEGGEDVLDVLSRHPQTYLYISGKLLRFYLHPEPDSELVAEGARVLRDLGTYGFLNWLFTHEVFYSSKVRNALVKSPIEYLVGLLYASGQSEVTRRLVSVFVRMGQIPFQPPGVDGWPSGRRWLSDAALLARLNMLPLVLRNGGDLEVFMDGGSDLRAAVLPEAQML